MNVRELIEKLQRMPQDMEVWAWVDYERHPVARVEHVQGKDAEFFAGRTREQIVMLFAPDPDLEEDG